ncbi:MAG: tetratricopeptide repeat protein [Alphaproteobacteria bacterium]|nr:tetratricopeptide repeat protein [Alphaproteobacteria bacterium]
MSSELIRELEEDLRAENLAKLWRKHNHLIIGAVAALVVGVGIHSGWSHYRLSREQESGDRLLAAVDLFNENKYDVAGDAFRALSEEGTSGYASLGAFMHAESLLKAGKVADAIAAYEALAQDSGADIAVRDLASLQSVSLRMNEKKEDGVPEALDAAMKSGRPFASSAKELKAVYLMQHGKSAEAAMLLAELVADTNTQQSMKARAEQMLSTLTADAPAAEDKKTEEPKSDDAAS